VLKGERRQMRVRHQVPGGAAFPDDLAEHLLMPRSRYGNPGGWPGQPVLNTLPRIRRRRGRRVYARIGDNPEKGQQAGPGQANRPGRSGSPLIKPVPRGRVVLGVLVGRVDEDIRVDQIHQR
jgi:hypothetical protein